MRIAAPSSGRRAEQADEVARLGADGSQAIGRNVQCGALYEVISQTQAGGRLRLAETEDARGVVVRRCAVWSVATQVSRLRDWKVTTCG